MDAINNTVKYYYSDPLAAAWMAKHFGMKFDNVSSWDDRFNQEPPFYIHHDSVPLLKPHSGDRLLWRGYGRKEWKYEEAYTNTTMKGWDFLILQRNDIPFMWPEKDNG